MDIPILVTLGVIYSMAMLPLLLFRKVRKFALATGAAAVVATLTLMIFLGSQLRQEALSAGFRTADDKRDADKAGITNPAEWDKQRETILKNRELAEQKARLKAQKDNKTNCEKDFDCWANRFQRRASRDCTPHIEQLAKNNFEWTDTFSSPKFPRAVISADKNVITYVGDALKMQNGFGAWIIVTYECDFDTNQQAVLAVRANQGQLPN